MNEPLTEKVEARVDADTKAALMKLANNTARSEGAIVRLALKAYLPKKGK